MESYLVDHCSVGENSGISVEDFDDGLESLVGVGRRNPRSDSKEIQIQSGGNIGIDGDSESQLSSAVGIFRDGMRPVIDKSCSPFGGGGQSSGGQEFSQSSIEEFEEPGSGSCNLGVQFDGEGSDEVKILLDDGGFEVDHREIGEVGGILRGHERDEGVVVSLRSLLIGISQSAESSRGDFGVSVDGGDFEGDLSSGGRNQRIELSSDISLGSSDLEIRISSIEGEEIFSDGNSGENSINT